MSKRRKHYENKAVTEVTKHINKHGKLKGKNKQETKTLRGICPHHKRTKKGIIKPTLIPDPNHKGYAICRLCGARVPTQKYSEKKLREIHEDVMDFVNQAKFYTTAINAGSETVSYWSTFGVQAINMKKAYRKLQKVGTKQGSRFDKAKKNSQGISNDFGYWNIQMGKHKKKY